MDLKFTAPALTVINVLRQNNCTLLHNINLYNLYLYLIYFFANNVCLMRVSFFHNTFLLDKLGIRKLEIGKKLMPKRKEFK